MINGELIVDNFAGGGGASTGIELATGYSVDIAINHDPEAIRMHQTNHPNTKHYCEDVWMVDPVKVCNGRPVGLAWFSPDCKHFSKAKGGKPKDKNIRGLAWVACRWAGLVRPRVIMQENVEEFKGWGPLNRQHHPIKAKRYGATDARTVRQTCAIQPAYQLRLLPFAEFYADDASDLHDHGDDFRHRNRTQERHGQGVVRHGRRLGLRGLRGQNPADYGHYVPDVGIDAPGHLQGGRRTAERQPDGHHHQQSALHPELPVPRCDDRHRFEQFAPVAFDRRRLLGTGLHVFGPYVPDYGYEQTHAMVLLHLSVHILHRHHGRSGPARCSGDILVARHGHHRPVHHSSAAVSAAPAHHLHE